MLIEAEIFELLNEKIAAFKKDIDGVPDPSNKDRKERVFDKDKLPEFTAIYRDSVHLAKKIEVHSTIETFPETLFTKKAPNENLEQWEYRKANYRPKTKSSWSKAVGSAARIWNEQNWSLIFEEDSSMFKDELSSDTYFTEIYPEFKSIITYFKSVVHKRKFDDPNILVCNKPKELPEDQTQLIQPITVLYRAEQVVHFDDKKAMILLDEKSIVTTGPTKEKKGLIFELYDDKNIYRIVQFGERKDFKFTIEIWFEHDLELLPCTKLKGIPSQRQQEILYESFFNDAVASLDEALYDFSNLQLSKTAHAFPQRVEIAERCDDCEGSGLVDTEEDSHYQGARITCKTCNGSGDSSKQSVLGVTKRFAPDRLEANDKIIFPGLDYVEPGTDIYKFLNDQIKQNIFDAFMNMNLDVSDTARTGSKDMTATKSKIDREELFAFLEAVNDQEFGLLAWSIEIQGRMRYATAWKGFLLKKPTEFAIRNAAELTEEIIKSKEAMLPASILTNLNNQYAETRFATNDKEKKNVKLQGRMDALLYNSVVEINSMVGSGRIASWKSTMHYEWNQIISTLFEENDSFFELEFSEQKALIVTEAQARDVDNKPPVQNSTLQFENALANGVT